MASAALMIAVLLPGLFHRPEGYSPSQYEYGELSRGSAWIWRDAPVLATPDPSADTILTASRGSVVFITGDPAGSCIWRGIRAPFYPVACGTDEGVEGFIAGTDLAMAAVDLVEGPVLLCVLTGSPAGGQDGFTAAILALDHDGSLVDSTGAVIPGMSGSGSRESYHYIVGFTGADVSEFCGLSCGAILGVSYEACGRPWTSHLVAWNGERLVSGPSTTGIAESGGYHHFEDMVMPGEPGGMAGRILLATYDDVWDDALEDYAVTGRDTVAYVWTGTAFERR